MTAPTVAYDGTDSPLKPGETRTVTLAGKAGIPSSGPRRPVPHRVDAAPASTTAWLTLAGAPGTPVVATLRAASVSTSAAQMVLPGASGQLTLRNYGTVPVPFTVRTTGWTTTSATAGGGALSLLASPVVVADSSRSLGLAGAATSTAARAFVLPAAAKVPVGADAVLLQVSGRGGTGAARSRSGPAARCRCSAWPRASGATTWSSCR